MPSGRFSIFSRDQLPALARWVVLAVLVTVPLLLVPQLLLGREPGFFLPAEFGHGIGIVDAAPVPPAPVPATPPARRRSAHASTSTSSSTSTSTSLASLTSRRLVPVVTAACSSCRVTRNAANGAIRVTLGGAKRTTPGSAFALLDFGGLGGASGVVRVHDRIGLDRGQRLESDLSVLQVTDVDNRIAYRLQVDRSTRLLRLLSPPGGLSRTGLDISTGTIVPNDGVRTLAVDVAAQAGASIIVRINGRTVVSKNDLAGGDARKQRYLAVGILNTPAGFATMSVTHEELQVDVSSADGATQAGVSGTDLPLASAVTLVPPANVGAPRINGTMVTGETLTADVGSWTAADSVRVRWSRCAGDGSGCQPVPDATGTSYVTDSGDAGASFVINVTAVNAAGTAQAASAATPVVANFRPVNVTLPSTAGTPKQGSDLTASAGAWQWRNGSFTYAWQRCDASGSGCATVAGQTSATYTLGYPDVGFTIRVLVTAPGITASTVVAAPVTAVVQPTTPDNVNAPTVLGNAVTGAVLTATAGDWTDPSVSYLYSWERCTGDGVCAPIPGTNAATYRIGLEDLGSTLRVTVTASNAAGSGNASSSPTAPVTFGGPANSVLPTIVGDPLVGSTLSVSTGTWSDPQAALAVVWQRCLADGSACSAIADVSGTSYTLTDSDAGSVIEAVVTATNDGGSSSATSAATAVIGRAVPAPPASVAPPAINGDAVVGSTLSLDTGAWSDAQAALGIVWQRCSADGTACSAIAAAVGTSYALTADDVGSVIEAVVTATNAGGSASATSSATAAVVQAAPATPVPPANSTVPALTGDALVRSTLSVDTGTWSDPQAALGVAWQRCAADGTACATIAGATGTSYTLTDDDAGSVLEAVVTATNDGGSSSAVSSPSAVVTHP
jgi:hypothetical protein